MSFYFDPSTHLSQQTTRSGPITFALSLIRICHGVSLSSFNASSVLYSPEDLFSFLKAHGTYRIHFGRSVPKHLTLVISWLIDNNKDQEGLQVLADLHGGDLNNSIAQSEYKEIRAKVILEVNVPSASYPSIPSTFS